MELIAAIDDNWGLGWQGDLLFKIPDDMKRFKSRTLGKVVIMGRGTFESLPGQKPLVDRTNIILSSTLDANIGGVIICRTLAQLFNLLKGYNLADLFVIGGESIYTQLLPYCQYAHITRVAGAFPADKHLVCLDDIREWSITDKSAVYEDNNLEYSYITYINEQVCSFS